MCGPGIWHASQRLAQWIWHVASCAMAEPLRLSLSLPPYLPLRSDIQLEILSFEERADSLVTKWRFSAVCGPGIWRACQRLALCVWLVAIVCHGRASLCLSLSSPFNLPLRCLTCPGGRAWRRRAAPSTCLTRCAPAGWWAVAGLACDKQLLQHISSHPIHRALRRSLLPTSVHVLLTLIHATPSPCIAYPRHSAPAWW